MLRKTFGLILLLLLISSAPARADVKVECDTTAGWYTADANLAWNTAFTTRGDWSLGPGYAFFLKDTLGLSSTKNEWQGTLDRCYLQDEQGPIRLNLGRQGVTWGIGWFFRPTDLITPLTPLAEEDTRPGKDLAVVRWSTSPLTATDFIAGNALVAARSEWRIGDTNLRVLGLLRPANIDAAGFDFQGGLAGFYGEAAYRWAAADAIDQGRMAGLIGWKKVLGSGNQLYLEYYRNELNQAGSSLTNLLLKNQNQELVYNHRNYLAVGYQIPWDQLTTLAITGISGLDDGGTILEGTADVQLSDNLELRGTLMTLAGPRGTEFWSKGNGSRVSASVEVKYFF